MRFTRILAASRRIPDSYNNVPQRTVDRLTRYVERRRPNLPQYEQKIYRRKTSAYFDQWRPWEENFERLNRARSGVPKIFVEPIKHWAFFRGDRVEVIRGPEKGKQGIINYIVKERNWVFVEGVNLRRFYGDTRRDTNLGHIMSSEEPLLVNFEVKLVDPTDLAPTDFEWRYDDDGNRVRVSTRTERIIPIPDMAYETMDYVTKSNFKEGDKDTIAKEANKVSFVPKAKTFEMDICDDMGIKDDRVPYPMYWY